MEEKFTRISIEKAYGFNYMIPYDLISEFNKSMVNDDKDRFNEKFGKFRHSDAHIHTIFIDNEIYLKIN